MAPLRSSLGGIGQVVLFGRYREGGTRAVALTGTVNGKPVRYEFKGTLRIDAVQMSLCMFRNVLTIDECG